MGQWYQGTAFKKVRHSGATCEPRVHEAGTGGLLWVWNQPGLHCECEASLDYSVTLCLKQNKAKQKKKKNQNKPNQNKPRKENDAIPKGHTPVILQQQSHGGCWVRRLCHIRNVNVLWGYGSVFVCRIPVYNVVQIVFLPIQKCIQSLIQTFYLSRIMLTFVDDCSL